MRTLNAEQDAAVGWAAERLQWSAVEVSELPAEASGRQYLRLHGPDAASRVLMISPPERGEKNAEFVAISALLHSLGVRAPEVFHHHSDNGWMLLTDFGDQLYLQALQDIPSRQGALYRAALDVLVQVHGCPAGQMASLQSFGVERMSAETGALRPWYLEKLLGLECDEALWRECERRLAALAADIARQPVVLTHFDFHSRNLLATGEAPPAVLDFQDALAGPVGLDLVSLLRDCYIELDEAMVDELLDYYRRAAIRAGILAGDISRTRLFNWFNQCGLQRHVRILATFARLVERDGKVRYLQDIPLTLKYALRACDHLEDTGALVELLRGTEASLQMRLREPGLQQ